MNIYAFTAQQKLLRQANRLQKQQEEEGYEDNDDSTIATEITIQNNDHDNDLCSVSTKLTKSTIHTPLHKGGGIGDYSSGVSPRSQPKGGSSAASSKSKIAKGQSPHKSIPKSSFGSSGPRFASSSTSSSAMKSGTVKDKTVTPSGDKSRVKDTPGTRRGGKQSIEQHSPTSEYIGVLLYIWYIWMDICMYYVYVCMYGYITHLVLIRLIQSKTSNWILTIEKCVR